MKRLNEAANAELLLLAGDTPLSMLDPEFVLLHAADETSALHPFFEWDDTEAAREYRLIQARGLIRMAVVVLPARNEPVRAFVSLSTDRSCGGGYRRTRDVLDDPELRAVMLQDALAELRLIQRKYSHLQELSALWQALEAADRQTKGDDEGRAAA
jgi:hypothetical protein